MRYPSNIREEELKNRVAADFFHKYDSTGIIKDIDFAVKVKNQSIFDEYLLWAEAKKSATDIIAMLAQLVLTIGKARTFNEVLPPKFLGCFDCEKIAFIPYADIQDVFHQNDFNWNVTPSNHNSREFKQIYSQIDKIINNGDEHKTYRFDFERDEKSLKLFILKNFMPGGDITKIRIDKNNFISVYAKWLDVVKPTIAVDWDLVKKSGIIDGDFYLADLLSSENKTLKEKLFVLLKTDYYELDRKIEQGLMSSKKADFTDRQKAHGSFWAIYERPPREDYWDYIIERRDLLVPQDIRERKGSFFTPQKWVELSQKYIADVLGENWQEEYYVWDCAAGTGNLLAGLTNPRNIWASTLDQADVDVMKSTGFLFENQVFQFDFLNDDFGKLPKGLRDIVNDENKRKKLVVYINPPYAEVATAKTRTNTGENKNKVEQSTIHSKYSEKVGIAMKELFAQFLVRVYGEIEGCFLANFSTLKILLGPNFFAFRKFFQAKLEKSFVVPANTFDNVNGHFPIGFFIWNTGKKEIFKKAEMNIFDKDGKFIGNKFIFSYDDSKFINDWIIETRDKNKGNENIAYLGCFGNDFLNQNIIRIMRTKEELATPRGSYITQGNLIEASVYFAVRKVIPADWLNDRDQFLYPNDGWKTDLEFQSDCLAYTLFSNNISSKHGTNHWIPFTEKELGISRSFDSHFMSDFIAGKIKLEQGADLFAQHTPAHLAADRPPLEAGNYAQLNVQSNSNLELNPNNFKDIRTLPYNKKLDKLANEKRKEGWLHETVIWNKLKHKQFLGMDFYRQQIIGNYIVDFYSPNGGVVVEADGKSHETKIEYDKKRDEYLKSLGLKVMHIQVKDILKNINKVMKNLKEEIKKNFSKEPFPASSGASLPPSLLGCAAVGGAVKCASAPIFSPETQSVLNAGRELWMYYHKQPKININAAFYDIREYFQGSKNGKMNTKSSDETYNELIGNLRAALKELAKKIEPKVYEYGFLRG